MSEYSGVNFVDLFASVFILLELFKGGIGLGLVTGVGSSQDSTSRFSSPYMKNVTMTDVRLV